MGTNGSIESLSLKIDSGAWNTMDVRDTHPTEGRVRFAKKCTSAPAEFAICGRCKQQHNQGESEGLRNPC